MLTDGGSSFKGVFNKYLYEHGVDHRVSRVGRHHQLSNVDSLCRQLGDIFNGIMNKKEAETGKTSKGWVNAIGDVREKLNAYRRKRGVKIPNDITTHEYQIFDPTVETKKILKKTKANKADADEPIYKTIKPKFKEGDLVSVLYQEPHAMTGQKQNTPQFRVGDLRLEKKKRKVLKVLYYSGNNPYRYLIEGLSGASYTEQELKQV